MMAQCSTTKETVATQGSKEMMDFRSKPPAPGPAPVIKFGETQKFTLDNGLKVILVENHKLPRVSWQLTVDTWPFTEGDKAGAANLTGQLLSSGTTTKSKAELDAAIDFIGAQMSTFSSGAFASSLTKHSDTVLGLMADVLLNPSFPQEELDKIKRQTISGLQFQKDDPNTIANNVGNVLNYGAGSALGELTTETTVGNVTVDDCKSYYNKYFKPNISYLVVVGDIDMATAKSMINKHLGSWKEGDVMREQFVDPTPPMKRTIDFVHKDGAVQSVINVTYPIEVSRQEDDYVAASVMNTIFGGFFNSRLNLNLREKNAYTYGARSSLSPSRWIGEFSTGMSVRNEVTDSAMTNILMEFDQIINTPISQQELDFVKSYRNGNFSMSLEQPQTLANFALNIERLGLPADYYETYLQKLEALTTTDIENAAKKYLKPDAAHFIVVGNKDEVAEKLEPFVGEGEKINFYDTYGNPVEEIKGGVPEGLTAQNVIDDYLNAIGGKDEISKVKNVVMLMGANIQGQPIDMKVSYAAPDKVKQEMMMGGMVMQGSIINGDKGVSLAQGQKIPMTPEQVESGKAGANPFGQVDYGNGDYTLEIKGLEAVGDSKCYKIEVTDADGKKSMEFYDIATGFLVKSVAEGPAGNQVVTEMSNYEDVDGFMMPKNMSVVGMAPFPLNFEIKEASVNGDLPDSVFSIE